VWDFHTNFNDRLWLYNVDFFWGGLYLETKKPYFVVPEIYRINIFGFFMPKIAQKYIKYFDYQLFMWVLQKKCGKQEEIVAQRKGFTWEYLRI